MRKRSDDLAEKKRIGTIRKDVGVAERGAVCIDEAEHEAEQGKLQI